MEPCKQFVELHFEEFLSRVLLGGQRSQERCLFPWPILIEVLKRKNYITANETL